MNVYSARMDTALIVLVIAIIDLQYCDAYPIYPGDNAPVKELVKYYFSLSYRYDDICGFLLFCHNIVMSSRSLKRILRRLHLQRNNCEESLQNIVRNIFNLLVKGYGNVGYRTLWKILNVHVGIPVKQSTVRSALQIIDPEGVRLRAHHRMRRRIYVNRGPNYLIHIDGYDKLKPFGIAIHGAIDGFSRKILWLKAGPSNNNPQYTANFYIQYVKSIRRLPRCLRSDRGTENVLLRDIHLALHACRNDNLNWSPYFTGTSSANQRIERFWRCLREALAEFWRNLFKDMRDAGTFNDTNLMHIECIRFCFLSLIQKQLDCFTLAWNLHRVRPQRNVETPSGIPNVLYYQPEIFDGRDYSYDLPCSLEALDRVMREFTKEFPPFGCSEEFTHLMELLTNTERRQLPMPSNVDEACLLFRTTLEALNIYQNTPI